MVLIVFQDGETGLHKASRKGHTAVVALLLKREASVDKRNKVRSVGGTTKGGGCSS